MLVLEGEGRKGKEKKGGGGEKGEGQGEEMGEKGEEKENYRRSDEGAKEEGLIKVRNQGEM